MGSDDEPEQSHTQRTRASTEGTCSGFRRSNLYWSPLATEPYTLQMRHTTRTESDGADALLYERIADELGAMVRRGALRSGERLPTLAQLARA